MSDIRTELLAAFEVEHREHLEAIRRALDAAAHGRPADFRDVLRRAHSLKGAARAVDLPVVEELAHRLETLFEQVFAGRRPLDRQASRAVELGLDTIERHVAENGDGRNPGPAQEAAAKAEAEAKAEAALDALLAEPAHDAPEREPLADDTEDAPDPAAAGSDPVPAASPEAAPSAAEYLRVPAGQVDALAHAMHGVLREVQASQAMGAVLGDLEREATAVLRRWQALGLQSGTPAGGETARAPAARREEFERALRSLTRGVRGLARAQRSTAWSLDQAVRGLRETIDQVSLVPVEAIFGGFARMVRDLARAEGREAVVQVDGLELQADRRVLQALKDPVLHLVRNAVSHGAEPAAERVARGKPAELSIRLAFALDGRTLTVTVSDDGRGPDLGRIEEVAVARGLIRPLRAGERARSAERLLALVFEAGFSTARAIDRLSGRGVGLSVVAEAVRRMHGTAVLSQREPWGTEAVLAVPVSTAQQMVVLVEVGQQGYGLAGTGVERLLRLDMAALESIEGQTAARIDIDGSDVIVPLIPLAALIGTGDAAIPIESGTVNICLLNRGGRRCALAVDAFTDARPMLAGDVEAIGIDREIVAGVALIDGHVPVLMLSPDGLIERWLRGDVAFSHGGFATAAPVAARTTPTILVVDDSITTRTLEKSILEAQGYRVLLSVDGLDALTLLRGGDALVDLVVADVEMPRMDGFSLLQALKSDARLSAIPVILMTSRADPEDVRRGLDLGAEAYVTKQKFDQRELLATIGQLL